MKWFWLPHDKVSQRLLVRLGIFLVISVISLGFVIHDVAIGDVAWYYAALSLILGIVVGYILGRILTVRWHETKQKAVLEMDIVGFIAIAVYIGLRLSENWLLGHWFSGVALSTLGLALLSGALFGRFLGLRTSVAKLLQENP